MEFLEHTLSNRFKIVAESNPRVHSSALGFFVTTGARDETDEIAGVSHFLEHMVFKGTPNRTADDVNRQFDEMGAHYNAFTSEEATVYYAAILPEFQERTVELWADVLRPSLREEDFETEKKVILEEIHMYEDQPPFGADEKCRAAHFGTHPLGRSVLGSVQTITDLTADQMRNYFRRRYSPGNIVLAAAGRIDFDALVSAAERYCGNWEPLEAGRQQPPAKHGSAFQVIRKESATQQYVVRLSCGPAADQSDRYAAKLLATALGDDTGSRFYWELIDPGLAESASLSHAEYEGAGVFATYLSGEPEQTADNLQRILDVFTTVENEGITADELARVKSKVRSRVVLSGEKPRGRLFAVGGDWVQRGQYRSIRDDLDEIAAVSLDAIDAVLTKYPLSQGTTVTIGPLAQIDAQNTVG